VAALKEAQSLRRGRLCNVAQVVARFLERRGIGRGFKSRREQGSRYQIRSTVFQKRLSVLTLDRHSAGRFALDLSNSCSPGFERKSGLGENDHFLT
jgi:hypothetical protein